MLSRSPLARELPWWASSVGNDLLLPAARRRPYQARPRPRVAPLQWPCRDWVSGFLLTDRALRGDLDPTPSCALSSIKGSTSVIVYEDRRAGGANRAGPSGAHGSAEPRATERLWERHRARRGRRTKSGSGSGHRMMRPMSESAAQRRRAAVRAGASFVGDQDDGARSCAQRAGDFQSGGALAETTVRADRSATSPNRQDRVAVLGDVRGVGAWGTPKHGSRLGHAREVESGAERGDGC